MNITYIIQHRSESPMDHNSHLACKYICMVHKLQQRYILRNVYLPTCHVTVTIVTICRWFRSLIVVVFQTLIINSICLIWNQKLKIKVRKYNVHICNSFCQCFHTHTHTHNTDETCIIHIQKEEEKGKTMLSVAHTGLCVDHTASVHNQPNNVSSAT